MPDGITNAPKYEQTALGVVGFSNVDSLPTQNVDAFSRLRTANPAYRFDSQFTYRIDADLWDKTETGDATVAHGATDRDVIITAGTTAGTNTGILQSHYHAPYTPGRSQLVFITFYMPGTVPANGERGVGYYDGTNGVYLKETASGVTLNLETTTSADNQSATQANWNLDTLDGSGDANNPSGIELDLTKTQIMVVQLQALYSGMLVVGFDIDGEIIPVHRFLNANVLSAPYIGVASLPVRYWAKTVSDASSCIIEAICSSVISEGGDDLHNIPGREFAASGSVTDSTSGTVLVIRPKAQLNSINSHTITIPVNVHTTIEDAGCWIEVRRNATVTAGTFEDVNALSSVEVSYAGNAGTDPVVTAGTGQLIDKFYLPASGSRDSIHEAGLIGKSVLCYSHLLSNADNLAIVFNGGGATTDVYASLKWKEIR